MRSWEAYAEEKLEALERVGMAMARLTSAELTRAYSAWAELLFAPPDPCIRALTHMTHKELSRAM
eukprot:7389840-Prymnesium_polylepis.1